MTRPRVWHVGGEDVFFRIPLLRALRERGFDVAAVGSAGEEHFESAGIEFHGYPLDRGFAPYADRRSLSRLKALVEQGRPDVVHAFDTKPAVITPLAAAGAPGVQCVRTITGMGTIFSYDGPRYGVLRLLYRAAQRRADRRSFATIFQNEDDRAYFQRHRLVRESRPVLIRGSGVDVGSLRTSLGERERLRGELGVGQGPLVLMVSRLVHGKGIDTFVDAAREVRRDRPDAVFVLVGDSDGEGRTGVDPNYLRRNEDAVRWLGRRSDVSELMAAADVFALPSRYREGVPRVLLEAGSLGLPLVTTSTPGCADVVVDGEGGYIVPPGDPSALAAAVRRLVEDPVTAREMGARSSRRVEELFSLDRVTEDHAALYRSAIAAAFSGGPS